VTAAETIVLVVNVGQSSATATAQWTATSFWASPGVSATKSWLFLGDA
jgi:hypothetical protein